MAGPYLIAHLQKNILNKKGRLANKLGQWITGKVVKRPGCRKKNDQAGVHGAKVVETESEIVAIGINP